MKAEQYLKNQIARVLKEKNFDPDGTVEILLEKPRLEEHGDLSTNVALLLASRLKRKPREIAEEILTALSLEDSIVAKAEVAGAGFINFYLSEAYYRQALQDIFNEGENFGKSTWGNNVRVQIEFVSANPTGPLNVVSARAATVGDVLANLFNAVGFDTQREYYVNDAGRQVRLLGMSVSSRYMELLGFSEPFPEDGYHGDYIRDIAGEFLQEHGDKFARLKPEERWQKFAQMAVEKILDSQKRVLEKYRVYFDHWFRESHLRAQNAHLKVLDILKQNNFTYEKDGAVWFRSSQFGDEKDRPLVTREGEPTYFLVDIAYHQTKYERGFEKLYDLWGPDHHGYIPRMRAALQALGYPEDSFEVLIIQQVNLIQDGQPVKMSKRAGKIIEMEELIEDVGVDVARYFFLTRRNESPLDFDIDLARKTSEENPVYYVQYAHARISNILKYAESQGVTLDAQVDLNLLQKAEELQLIKKLLEFPQVVSISARQLEPHRLPVYLQELAATFHRFYHHHRVVSEDKKLTQARLFLINCTRIVLANALKLLGISAPERM